MGSTLTLPEFGPGKRRIVGCPQAPALRGESLECLVDLSGLVLRDYLFILFTYGCRLYFNVLDTSWYYLMLGSSNKTLNEPGKQIPFGSGCSHLISSSLWQSAAVCAVALPLITWKACQPLRRKSSATSRGSCRFEGRVLTTRDPVWIWGRSIQWHTTNQPPTILRTKSCISANCNWTTPNLWRLGWVIQSLRRDIGKNIRHFGRADHGSSPRIFDGTIYPWTPWNEIQG